LSELERNISEASFKFKTFYRLQVHYAILATLEFTLRRPSSAVRVFSLGSFSIWLVELFARLVVRFALVGGTFTSVGGTLVGGETRLNY
jgi:hypothetical protein